jgi:hypothetical protein
MIGIVLVDDCHPSGQQKKFRIGNDLLGFAYRAELARSQDVDRAVLMCHCNNVTHYRRLST